MTPPAPPLFSSLLAPALRIVSPPWIDPAIRGVSDDSRRVRPGDLFIARPGVADDGGRHLAEAIAHGAVAVLGGVGTARALAGLRVVAVAEVDPGSLREAAGVTVGRFFGDPSRRLDLVGVTGTNGKTTTCFLIRQLLAAVQIRCGLMGTVLVDDGRESRPAELTTPGAIELHESLARMVAHGCSAAAIEVSSHALDQDRVAGLRFNRAVFTNLSGDHLDYHGSMEAYLAAKRRLFESLDEASVAVVHRGDAAAAAMVEGCRASVLDYAIAEGGREAAAVRGRVGFMDPSGTDLLLETPWGEATARLPLVGRHNVENALAAVAVAGSLGMPFESIIGGLATLTAPPGRFERVQVPEARFSVLVDYAHTDDALRRALEALRPVLPPGAKLRCVFGCGGDRDRSKRPRMAAVACALADQVIVTSDNPRTESPGAIVEEVLTGVAAADVDRVEAVVDRRDAIRRAVECCERGDILLIAGKGHEDYQIVGREKRAFDDRREAAAALAARFAAVERRGRDLPSLESTSLT